MAKILIVDDEGVILMLLKRLLKNLGHEVLGEANNGVEAIEKALDLDPDLILMDISMPGKIDGIEAAKQIRENSMIPLVFVTAYSENMYQNRLSVFNKQYGYLVKPFNVEQLEEAIRAILESPQGTN